MKNKFFITVFTPAFNRANLLPDVYNSLKKQTFKDFEWLIVDDGSTDNTKQIVDEWINENKIHIRYYRQENSGKHIAKNYAVQLAEGDFFFTLDSDDTILPSTLERFFFHWNNIPETIRHEFAGIAGLTRWSDDAIKEKRGKINGTPMKCEIIDTNMIDIRRKYHLYGEKCGMQKTEIMRKFPAPVFPGEKFMPEAVVWRRIAQHYKTRYVNEIFRTVNVYEDGLSAPGSFVKRLINNPNGIALANNEFLPFTENLTQKLRTAAAYSRAALHAKWNLIKIISQAKAILPVIIILPLACLYYFKDKAKRHSC